MTQSVKHLSKGTLLAALDIGSSKTACFIARTIDDHGKLEIVGVGHNISKGIKNGTIVDLQETETVVRQTVHAAENMAASIMKGYPLREIIVNVSGIHTHSHAQQAEIKIGGYDVTNKDITRALSKAQDAVDTTNKKLIHTIPISYILDHGENIREPRGMNADTMVVDIHLITSNINTIRNISMCVERSHLDIKAFCTSAYAAGLSSLVEDEMDLGCTVIDIGGGTTSFAVFHDGHVIYTDAVPIGGQHITNDIAKGLTTSIKDAERFKCVYGSTMATHTDEIELLDIPRVGEMDRTEPNHVPRSVLTGIIQPRVEEIFEMVRGKLKDSGLSPVVGQRVILTGGTSQLHGITELAGHVLDKQIRLGHPIRLNGLPDAASGPAFSAVAGLLSYISQHAHEIPTEIKTQANSGSIFERARQWLKENW